MTRVEAEIIVNLAKNNLNTAKTAEKMRCHKNTINHYINTIKAKTGANPREFCDLRRLLTVAEEILRLNPLEIADYELVTRCRNCKYWLEDFGDVCSREEDWFYMAPDDFCSRGIERGEAHE